jgi:hypothetical protein
VKTAQQAQTNWTGSAGRAATDYAAGVNNYSGDWAGATTRQQAALLANFNTAISSGKWANSVNAVGTAGWKAKTQAKVQNYSTGFAAGSNDYGIAIGKIMNALGTIVPNLPARGTYEQNKTRSTSLMDALHALNGQLGAK